jgi:ATP-dependent helicase/nuclease subunit B
MKQWLLDKPDLSALEAYNGIPDVAAFLAWVDQFQKFCADSMLISLADSTRQLTTSLSNLPQALPQELVLVNFYQPPPLYELLFEQLHIATRVFTASAEGSPTAPGCRYEFADLEQEVSACADWTRLLLQQQADAHIGIIFNGADNLHKELERRISDSLDPASLFDFSYAGSCCNSTGSPHKLLKAAPVHDAFLLLNLHQEMQKAEDLCRLLQSPWLLNQVHENTQSEEEEEIEQRIRLEQLMRRYFSANCSVTEFLKLMSQADKPWFCPRFANALLAFRTHCRKLPKLASARQWACFFTELLNIFGWPQNAEQDNIDPVLSQWQKVLQQFATAGIGLPPLRFEQALTRLRQLCGRSQQGRAYEAKRQISLYTVAEASGLQFDHVWLLGFDDQSWPTSVSPSPFLPYALQREVGIPGSDTRLNLEQAESAFRVLCNSVTSSLVASHHLAEGDQQFRPSTVILNWHLQQAAAAGGPALNAHARTGSGEAILTRIADTELLPISDAEAVSGGHAIISNQSACPFRAFATHRLKTGPLPEFMNGLSPMARGSAIHEALESLFERIQSHSELLKLSDQEALTSCGDAANRAIEYLSRRHPHLMTPEFKKIEQQRITTLLDRFLQQEKERGAFRVIGRELKQQWKVGSLTLNLIIDRIDQLDDNSLALIDYKTGKRSISRLAWLDERPEDMQLPVYFVVSMESRDETVSAVSIAHVNAENIGYSGLAATANFHNKVKPVDLDNRLDRSWEELTTDFEQKVKYFANEFSAGHCRVDPAHGSRTCQYCGLQSLCRIRDLQDADGEGEAGDSCL